MAVVVMAVMKMEYGGNVFDRHEGWNALCTILPTWQSLSPPV